MCLLTAYGGFMKRSFALVISVLSLAGCAIDRPDSSNLAAYCTPQNAFLLGSQSRAYFGVCPKETEAAFLEGLHRGRALVHNVPQVYPYYVQMTELEKQLVAAGSEAERERVRTRLREAETWAIHLINDPGTYGSGGGRD